MCFRWIIKPIKQNTHTHTQNTHWQPISELLLQQDWGSLTTQSTFIFLDVIVIVLTIIIFHLCFINETCHTFLPPRFSSYTSARRQSHAVWSGFQSPLKASRVITAALRKTAPFWFTIHTQPSNEDVINVSFTESLQTDSSSYWFIKMKITVRKHTVDGLKSNTPRA